TGCKAWQSERLPTIAKSTKRLATAIAVSRDSEVQKILNRRINSCRASIACSGFIRLSIFSRRSRSIAASSRTSWLRAFHFAYLAEPMPSASRAERIQTVMSVAVTRSMSATYKSRSSFAKTRRTARLRQGYGVRRDRRSLEETGVVNLTLRTWGGDFPDAFAWRGSRRCGHWRYVSRCPPGAIARG